jgi:hypothetical protein
VEVVEVVEEKEEGPSVEEQRREKMLKECAQAWNGFIEGLLKAHGAWERYCRFRLNESIQLEEYPLEVQKIFYLVNPYGEFSLLVDDQLTRPPVEEYLKSQLVKI